MKFWLSRVLIFIIDFILDIVGWKIALYKGKVEVIFEYQDEFHDGFGWKHTPTINERLFYLPFNKIFYRLYDYHLTERLSRGYKWDSKKDKWLLKNERI